MVPNPAQPFPLSPSTGPSSLAFEAGRVLPTCTVLPCLLSCAGGLGAAQAASKRAALASRGARRSSDIGARIVRPGPGGVKNDGFGLARVAQTMEAQGVHTTATGRLGQSRG